MAYYDVFSEDEERKTRKLTDLEIEEISLVDAPANRARFQVIKRRGENMELENIVNEFIAEGGELSESVKKALDEDAKKALIQALSLLKKYLPDMPPDVADAVKVLAAAAAGKSESYGEKPKKKPKDYGYSYPEKSDEAKQKSLAKSGALWPSLAAAMGGGPAAEPGEDDLPESVPQLRSLSKGLKGQGDEEIEEKNLWPSLG